MKLHSLVIALAVGTASISAPVASAQAPGGALYLNPVAVRASISPADPGLFSFLGPGTTSRMFWGLDYGIYQNVPSHVKNVEFGIDFRNQVLHGNNALLSSWLWGLRIGFDPFHNRIHPYIQPEVGVGTTRAPNTAIKVNKFQGGAFGGVDVTLNKRISWRAVEVGYSTLVTASGGTIGASESINAATLVNVSTGLLFRIP
jgi:hypothetical protein